MIVAMANPVIKMMLIQVSIFLNFFMIVYFIFSDNFEIYFLKKKSKKIKKILKKMKKSNMTPFFIFSFFRYFFHFF